MRATKNGLNKGINQAHNKGNNFARQFTLIELKTGKEIITVKLYKSTIKTTACVRVFDKGDTFAGSDISKGQDFDRSYNAALGAFKNAGFDLTGNSNEFYPIYGMMYAVAELLGYTNVKAYIASP